MGCNSSTPAPEPSVRATSKRSTARCTEGAHVRTDVGPFYAGASTGLSRSRGAFAEVSTGVRTSHAEMGLNSGVDSTRGTFAEVSTSVRPTRDTSLGFSAGVSSFGPTVGVRAKVAGLNLSTRNVLSPSLF